MKIPDEAKIPMVVAGTFALIVGLAIGWAWGYKYAVVDMQSAAAVINREN